MQGIERQLAFGDTRPVVRQWYMDTSSQLGKVIQDFVVAPVLGQEQVVLPQTLLQVAGGFMTEWIAVDVETAGCHLLELGIAVAGGHVADGPAVRLQQLRKLAGGICRQVAG